MRYSHVQPIANVEIDRRNTLFDIDFNHLSLAPSASEAKSLLADPCVTKWLEGMCQSLDMIGIHSHEETHISRSFRLRSMSMAMALTLTSGGAGLLVSATTGLTCPFRAVGLACPGCGCGRAVSLVVKDGIAVALASQPTATLLLLSMVAILIVSLAGWRSRISAFGEEVVFRFSGFLLIASGLANLINQIKAAP